MSFRMRAYGGTYQHIYFGLHDEVPNLSSWVDIPPPHDAHEVADDPVFLSPDRTLCKRWLYRANIASYQQQTMPIAAVTVEWVWMKTPAGVLYVYGLGDDGLWYTELFESGVPKNRRVTSTVLHHGQRLWVADPKQKPPRGGI